MPNNFDQGLLSTVPQPRLSTPQPATEVSLIAFHAKYAVTPNASHASTRMAHSAGTLKTGRAVDATELMYYGL
jgi:hypothetical protein